MLNEIKEQFVRDMQVAGLSVGTQKCYISSVNVFLRYMWTSPEEVTERDLQDFLIAQRDSGVARDTFQGYRFGLQFFFKNTLQRDWPLFKKN